MPSEKFDNYAEALKRAFDIFGDVKEGHPEVRKWIGGRLGEDSIKVRIQSDVAGNRRASLVNGFHGKFGRDGGKMTPSLRLDWDETNFSHLNVISYDSEGNKISYHLMFGMPMGDHHVLDLMERLDERVHVRGESVTHAMKSI